MAVHDVQARPVGVRRVVLVGVPALYVVLGLLHPTANPELGDETDLFVWLHVGQLVLITGLAFVLWFLVDGLESRTATVARVLIVPFVVAYTALDAVLGAPACSGWPWQSPSWPPCATSPPRRRWC